MTTRHNGARIHDVREDDFTSSRLTLQKIMDMDLQQVQHDIILAVEQPDGQKVKNFLNFYLETHTFLKYYMPYIIIKILIKVNEIISSRLQLQSYANNPN